MRRCQDLVKHQGAGPTPPGRGQKETDKCAAAGGSPGSRLRGRPRVPARLQGCPAPLPCSRARRPATQFRYPDPMLQVDIPAADPTPPTPRSPASWLYRPPRPGSSAASPTASWPAAGAARGRHQPPGPGEFVIYPAAGAPEPQPTPSPTAPLEGPVNLTHFPSSCSLTDSI